MLPNILISSGLAILGFVLLAWLVMSDLKRRRQELQPNFLLRWFRPIFETTGAILMIWPSCFLAWHELQQVSRAKQVWVSVLALFIGMFAAVLAIIVNRYLKTDISLRPVNEQMDYTTPSPSTRLRSYIAFITVFILFGVAVLLIADSLCLLVVILINITKS